MENLIEKNLNEKLMLEMKNLTFSIHARMFFKINLVENIVKLSRRESFTTIQVCIV